MRRQYSLRSRLRKSLLGLCMCNVAVFTVQLQRTVCRRIQHSIVQLIPGFAGRRPRTSPSTHNNIRPLLDATLRHISSQVSSTATCNLDPLPDFPDFGDLAEFSQSQLSSVYLGSSTQSGALLPVAAPHLRCLKSTLVCHSRRRRTA